ncbi:MAG: drug efflux system protein MdtG [Methanosaeta sp. PtaB.Bin039]|nr:MAG: drug efflux system protein MdtG [Methanosaeta sp. PtaB.Bin039]OPY44499.1 MAG: drug efflux system protein MdtG [Methanosaeta sp. PtaU1.Bin028]
MAVLGFSLVAPIFPLYVMDLGASYTLLGIVISVYGAVQLVTQVPAGRLSDRVGRKNLMIIGLLSFTLMPPLYLYAADPYVLIPIRAVGGAGASLVWPLAMALIVDRVSPARRGSAMGWYNASFYSAMAVGPAAGGLLYDLFGLSAPFLFWTALGLASLLIVIWRVREPERALFAVSITPHQEVPLIESGFRFTFLACCGAVMLAGIIGGFNITLLPELAGEVGLTTTQVGLLYLAYAGTNALTNIHFGNAADQGRRKSMIVLGSAGCVVSFIFLGSAFGMIGLMAVLAALGFASGMAAPAAAALVADVTSSERRGEIFGIFNTARMFGVVIGPLMAGAAADAEGLRGALLVFVAISAIITAATLLVQEPKFAY